MRHFLAATLVTFIAAWYFAGCAAPAGTAPVAASNLTLIGPEWELVSLPGAPRDIEIGERRPTLQLTAEGTRIAGFAGVNRFTGTYALEVATLAFSQVAATRMAGPPEAMALEEAYLGVLRAVTSWRIRGDRLELRSGERTVATFRVAGTGRR